MLPSKIKISPSAQSNGCSKLTKKHKKNSPKHGFWHFVYIKFLVLFIAYTMSHPEYKFSIDWFSDNIPVWEQVLSKYKDAKNLQFLEIGCFEGKCTVWLLENILTNRSSKITCIDTFEGSIEHHANDKYKTFLPTLYDTFCHNMSYFADQVTIKQGKSQDVLKGLNDKYDFIYIDGDHHASSVIEDAVLSFGLLKNGGIMIFDDYLWGVELANPNKINLNIPKNAIDSFLHLYSNKLKVLHVDYQVVIEKL
jgi:predicted O-methyltransferase YrrM